MRRPAALALALAGAVILVALFLLLRPDGDDEDTAATLPPAETGSTVEVATGEESESEPEDATTAETEAEPEPEPAEPTLRVTVRDGGPVGGIQRLRVTQGERVRIVVRADVSDHVHLHGYDVMRNVGPGRPAQLVVEATIPGRFELELEDRGLPIAELEVRP